MSISRRAFITCIGLTGTVLTLQGCPPPPAGSVMVFKRSGNRRTSNAAKRHNANRRYKTRAAAEADIPHPGDNSKVVMLQISEEQYLRYFPSWREVTDLRWVL